MDWDELAYKMNQAIPGQMKQGYSPAAASMFAVTNSTPANPAGYLDPVQFIIEHRTNPSEIDETTGSSSISNNSVLNSATDASTLNPYAGLLDKDPQWLENVKDPDIRMAFGASAVPPMSDVQIAESKMKKILSSNPKNNYSEKLAKLINYLFSGKRMAYAGGLNSDDMGSVSVPLVNTHYRMPSIIPTTGTQENSLLQSAAKAYNDSNYPAVIEALKNLSKVNSKNKDSYLNQLKDVMREQQGHEEVNAEEEKKPWYGYY
jgi:hypothetical protein